MLFRSLILFKRYFDAILRGEKIEEYRSQTNFWRKRLIGRNYSEIHFTNGYGWHRPFMRVECLGISEGEFEGRKVFVIKLGKILETKNIKQAELEIA